MPTIGDEYVTIMSIDDSQYKAKIVDLTTQQAPLLAQIKNIDAAIRSEAKTLADAQAAVAQYGTGQKSLNDALAQSQARLAGYLQQQTEVKNQLGQVGAALKAAQNQVDPLAKAYSDLGLKSSASLKQAATDAQAAFNVIRTSGTASAQDVKNAYDAMQKAVGAATIPQAAKGIGAAFSEISTHIKSAGAGLQDFGGMVTRAFAPISALGALALASSSDVNKAFREIRVNTGATGTDLAALKQDFANVFSTVPASAADAGLAIAKLSQLTGAMGPVLDGLATQELNLARITGEDLKGQVEATAKAFNNWKISTDQQGPALDTLFKISQLTGISVTQLAQQVTAGGASARAAGLSFQDTALLMGQLGKAGVDASGIMQGFARSFKQIATKDPKADPAAVLQDIITKIQSAGSAAQANKIAFEAFGRSGLGMADAIKNGRLNVEDLTKALVASKDTINGVAKDTQTFGETMTILKNKVELALAPLGKDMTGVLKSLMPDLTALINIITQISSAFTSLPQSTQAAVAGFVLLAGSIGPILIGVGSLIVLLGGPLTGVLVSVAALATVMALDWVENTGKMNSSIVGFENELIGLAKVVGTVMDVLGAVGHTLLGIFNATIGSLIGIVQSVTDIMQGKFSSAMDHLQEANRQATLEFNLAWDDVNGKWAARLQNMVGTAYAASSGFAGAGRANATAYQSGLSGVGIGLSKDPFANIPGPATSFSSTVKAMGAQVGTAAHTAGEGAATKFLEGLGKKLKGGGGGVAKAMVDVLQDGVAGLKAAIEKADVGDLSILFDKLKSKARAGAAELKDALKIVTSAINEFAQAMGVSSKLNEAQLANMDKPIRLALERETLAYKTAKEEINRIQVEDLAARGVIFAATQDQIDRMSDKAKKAFADLGGTFRIAPPALKEMGLTVMQVTGSAASDITKFAASVHVDFTKLDADFARLSSEAPKPFSAITLAAENAAKKLRDALAGNETLTLLRAQDDIRNSLKGTVDQLYSYGEAAGKTGASLDKFVTDAVREMGVFTADQQAKIALIIEAHKRAEITLPSIWNEVFAKMSSGAKSWAASIFGVLDMIPGKFGSTVKKVTDTIQQWATFFNSILGFLHKFVNAIPDSIGAAIGKMIGVLKTGLQDVKTLTGDQAKLVNSALDAAGFGAAKAGAKISGSIANASTGVKESFAAMAGAAASFTTALSITAATGSKTAGIVGSLFTSTLAGIQAGLAFGPIGGAIVGGVSLIGGIIGSLFGKSAQQKEQERLQNEKMKADIAASAQATMNAALEGFQKALAFLDSLDQFTAPRKAKFQEFWKAMNRLMDGFVILAKKFQNENLTKMKDVADAIGSVAQSIAAAPAAFDAINLSFTIPDSQFDVFFSNLDRFMDKFFARSDVWIEGTAKRAKKVADRLISVVDLIAPFTEGLKGLLDLKAVPEEVLNIFDQMLERMVQHIGALAEKFDKGWLKTMAFFAEKSQAALGLWKDATDAIRATVDVPRLDPGLIDVVVSNIEAFITRLITAAQNINSENLAKAASIAQSVLPIAAALKAWAEAAGVVQSYVAVASHTWDDITKDFNLAVSLMLQMLDQAIRFIPDAIKFEDTMKTIADHLKQGLAYITEGIQAAQSAFLGLVNVMSTPQEPIVGGGGLDGQSMVTTSSLAGLSGGYIGSSSKTSSSINFNAPIYLNGKQAPAEFARDFTDSVVKAMVEAQRRGRFKTEVV